MPRDRPHAILDADRAARRVICDGHGYGGNVRDIYHTMRVPIQFLPPGLDLPWHWLHPLLVRQPEQ